MSGLLAEHMEWLENRGLDVEIAVKHGLHSRGPALAIPYTVEGKQLYVKTRDPKDKTRTRCVPSGVDQVWFWNEECFAEAPKPNDCLIVTEGEFDALAMLQVGYQFVVSVPSGTSEREDGALSKALRVFTRQPDGEETPVLRPEVQRFTRIVILADGDAAGLNLRKAIISIVGEQYCWVPHYPHGTKDANEVLQVFGVEAARNLVEKSTPVKHDGFIDFITAERTTTPLAAMSCGIPFLEEHFRPVKPSFIVIGGQAGHGKSTITQSLVFNLLWRNSNLKASIFHAEGDKTIPVQRAKKFWKGKVAPLHMDEKAKAERDAWIADRLAYISPSQDEMPTFEWLMWAMEMQALFRKRNVFVIDPWNQIVHDARRMSFNKTDYIGECIYRMKRLADRFGLILFVAHHTTKAIDPTTPPNRYSLADSAHWVNAADHMILGWKPYEDQNLTRIEIAKSKDHDKMGKPGNVWIDVKGELFTMTLRAAPERFASGAKSSEETGQKPETSDGLAEQF